MLKEYMQVDTDGFIVEKFIYDDEEPESIPEDCISVWESKRRFFIPKYNKALSEWEEGASAEALAAEANRVNAIQNEESQPTEMEYMMLAIAEIDAQREMDKTESEMAIAELAEALMGGM